MWFKYLPTIIFFLALFGGIGTMILFADLSARITRWISYPQGEKGFPKKSGSVFQSPIPNSLIAGSTDLRYQTRLYRNTHFAVDESTLYLWDAVLPFHQRQGQTFVIKLIDIQELKFVQTFFEPTGLYLQMTVKGLDHVLELTLPYEEFFAVLIAARKRACLKTYVQSAG